MATARALVSGLEQSTCAELGEEIVEMQMGWVVHSHFVKDTEAISRRMPYVLLMK